MAIVKRKGITMTKHTERIQSEAQDVHDMRPCNFGDTDAASYRSVNDFARHLARNAGYDHPSESLIDAIADLVRQE